MARGEALASLYSTNFAEVRLPVRDQDLAYLPLSLTGTANESETAPEAILRARFLGSLREWTARVVRTEGELDPLTRVVNLIAQVERPYEPEPGSPQLLDAVYTNQYGSSCGMSISDGTEYVFFSDADGVVHFCDGSRPLWPDSEESKDLTKSLKRLASQQVDHEKTADPETPAKSP